MRRNGRAKHKNRIKKNGKTTEKAVNMRIKRITKTNIRAKIGKISNEKNFENDYTKIITQKYKYKINEYYQE